MSREGDAVGKNFFDWILHDNEILCRTLEAEIVDVRQFIALRPAPS